MISFDSYIICATPRSGSTLLCDLLTETGIAGNPDSFFRRESILWWADYLNVPVFDWETEYQFDLEYLSAVKEYGTNETSIFGMRLMWESVADLSKRLEAFFPDLPSDSARFKFAFGKPLYFHLSREDKIAQAISYHKAEQSGLWHIYSDGSERERLKPGEEPAYDAGALSQLVTSLEEHDASWVSWFAQQEIQPIYITYETLAMKPQTILASTLSALGLDPIVAESIRPKSARMADTNSQKWATRFRKKKDYE